MPSQGRLEVVEVLLEEGTLRKHHNVNVTSVPAGGAQHSVHQPQVEVLAGPILEGTVGLDWSLPNRTGHWPEVVILDTKRPR
jgi:hypothetical protein